MPPGHHSTAPFGRPWGMFGVLDLDRDSRAGEAVALSPAGKSKPPASRRLPLRRTPASAWRTVRADRRPFLLAGTALVAVVVTNQIDLHVHRFGIGLLNANWEFSWSHDLDTLALSVGMFAAGTGAWRHEAHRRLWAATAVILGLFFLDEASPLHGQIDRLPGGKVLYSPILLGLVACVWLLTADSDQRVLVVAGLTVLFLSFGMHVLGLHALHPIGYFSNPYQAGVGLKEGLELAGLFLVVVGLWRVARRPAQGAS